MTLQFIDCKEMNHTVLSETYKPHTVTQPYYVPISFSAEIKRRYHNGRARGSYLCHEDSKVLEHTSSTERELFEVTFVTCYTCSTKRYSSTVRL